MQRLKKKEEKEFDPHNAYAIILKMAKEHGLSEEQVAHQLTEMFGVGVIDNITRNQMSKLYDWVKVMKWTTSNIETLRSPLGVMVVIPAPHDNDLSKITTDKEYTVEIKRKTKSRSLNANSYCWVLCQNIALELSKHSYTTKEDVYKKAIKDCGHFTYVPVRDDAVERYIQIWQSHGIGWLAEDAGECKSIKGYHNIMCYHGSSVYNIKEMARLIDCLTDECEQLGVKLEPSEYIQSLIEGWESEQTKKE